MPGMTSVAALRQTKPSGWIHSPGLDLTVGCGAWSLPLLLFTYFLVDTAQGPAAMLFYSLALVCNYPHYMATIYRAYHTKEDFRRYRLFTLHFTVIAAIALITAHWQPRLVPWLFTIYITWSPWHYMGQNFGLAMMFIRRKGIKIDHKDRNALWTAFVASYLMMFLSFHTSSSQDPFVISLGLPSLLDLLRIPLMAVFAILGIWPISKLVRKAGWRAMLPAITLYITEFMWFVLPTVLELTTNYVAPQTRYSAGILALMHSAQYLWITSYYARMESERSAGTWQAKTYFGILALGGAALFIPGPWLASFALHREFSSSFLIFTALVNIHHFVLDGVVWKLRETRVASILVPEQRQTSPRAATTWTRKPSGVWRLAGIAAVAGLFILTGLDQFRYYLVGSPSMPNLETALTLNPFDVVTQTRMARFLIENGQYEKAYEHYRRMFEYIAPDAPSLTNLGMLCRTLNRAGEAKESFERAVQVNPEYAPAHLRLAELLEAEGRIPEAIPHYEEYVRLVSSRTPPNIVDHQLNLVRTRLENLSSERKSSSK